MLKAVQVAESPLAVQPTATSLASRLTGDYEVQVATHLTLVQLQSFGQDIVRSLRNIAQANGERDWAKTDLKLPCFYGDLLFYLFMIYLLFSLFMIRCVFINA